MVEAEFCGGPLCGGRQMLHAAVQLIHLKASGAAADLLTAGPGKAEAWGKVPCHVYRLRAGTPLGLSNGCVFYDYQGARRKT